MMPYIIVRCGPLCGPDEGVFTGHTTLVEAPTDMATGVSWIMQEGNISECIDNAYVFRDLFQATVCADRLMKRWFPEQGRYDNRTWFVRDSEHFALGENRHHQDKRHITPDMRLVLERQRRAAV